MAAAAGQERKSEMKNSLTQLHLAQKLELSLAPLGPKPVSDGKRQSVRGRMG